MGKLFLVILAIISFASAAKRPASDIAGGDGTDGASGGPPQRRVAMKLPGRLEGPLKSPSPSIASEAPSQPSAELGEILTKVISMFDRKFSGRQLHGELSPIYPQLIEAMGSADVDASLQRKIIERFAFRHLISADSRFFDAISRPFLSSLSSEQKALFCERLVDHFRIMYKFRTHVPFALAPHQAYSLRQERIFHEIYKFFGPLIVASSPPERMQLLLSAFGLADVDAKGQFRFDANLLEPYQNDLKEAVSGLSTVISIAIFFMSRVSPYFADPLLKSKYEVTFTDTFNMPLVKLDERVFMLAISKGDGFLYEILGCLAAMQFHDRELIGKALTYWQTRHPSSRFAQVAERWREVVGVLHSGNVFDVANWSIGAQKLYTRSIVAWNNMKDEDKLKNLIVSPISIILRHEGLSEETRNFLITEFITLFDAVSVEQNILSVYAAGLIAIEQKNLVKAKLVVELLQHPSLNPNFVKFLDAHRLLEMSMKIACLMEEDK